MLRSADIPDQMGDGGRAQADRRQVERHRAADKEALRSFQRGVELRQPIHDRRLRREHESHVGTRAKHQRLAGGMDARHDRSNS